MNILQSYASGFKTTVRFLKLTLVVYILNLLMGLTIAIPFMGALKEASGHSMAPQNLLKGFDFTSFQEILRHYGEEISSYLSHGFWIVLFFLILSIFLTGGILTAFNKKESTFSLKSFFSGCGTFFFRFFKVSLYTVFMHIILAVFVYLIFALIVAGMAGGTASEKTFFHLFVFFLGIHLLLGIYLIIITDYSRFMLVLNDSGKVLKSIWLATKFVTRKLPHTYGLYLMLLVIPLILFYLYMIASRTIGMTSGITILIMFVLQQLFIWLRISLRIWTFASQFDYYSDYFKQIGTK
ncbi:MAG: hypothetical protein KAU83_12105 [Bacteroidales bacterium]|nr:hypothetical protein [Bacteroidales bacterium]